MLSKSMKHFFVYLILPALCFLSVSGQAAELKLTEQDKTEPTHFMLVLDKAAKLAGMKLSLQYPKEILLFKAAAKTPATKNFLHVVNDKTPGRLVIVMASAKGITGNELELFKLEFSSVPISPRDEHKSFKIHATACQLMSEDLKEIPCNFSPYSPTSQEP